MRRQLVERNVTDMGPARADMDKTIPPARRTGRRTVTVNLAESAVSWLYARGHLTRREFDAGERLRMDWEMAQLAPSITMRWDVVAIRGGGGNGLDPTERQIAARQRFDGAVAAAGKGLSDILWRVVCANETLPVAEKSLEWPTRSGKLVLKLALDRVADFYRIT